ncbi:MAG: glycosyltransferase family 87 protein [Xanthobacteraceae bacterium]
MFTFGAIARPRRREWVAAAVVAVLILSFLPIVVRKTVWLGQGDVQVFFRAGWAIWTGYPLYQITDHHGWTYHYPPTFALLMGPFANPLPDHPQPWLALPFPAAVAVWYLINVVCLLLALHVWANAVERSRPIEAKAGYLQRHWALTLGPLMALLPFIGDGLARGQPTPVLLLLIVLFLALYVEKRVAAASFAFSLAVTIKIFPVMLFVIPLLRRDWTFMLWTVGWSFFLLIVLPVVCVGPAETFDLYRAMLTEHLLGIISGAMSHEIASQVSPGAFSNIGIGALVARIATGDAFYSAPLPQWASDIQFLFNAAVVAVIVLVGRGGFWNVRGAQPADGYRVLVAGAVLSAALPLMIPSAGPQYVTVAVPLMTVLLAETWRRKGAEIVTEVMIAWSIAAWLSMIVLEVPWAWLKLIGPMTWVLLLLAPPSLSVLRDISLGPRAAPAAARQKFH